MVLHLYDNKLEGVFNLNSVEFNELILTQDAVSNIIEHAKNSHPGEFVALIEGFVDNRILRIHDVSFRLSRNKNSNEINLLDLPLLTNIVGSVHSHPDSINKPSGKDIEVFNKRGGIHIIASYPFNAVNLKVYNCEGKELKFKIRRK